MKWNEKVSKGVSVTPTTLLRGRRPRRQSMPEDTPAPPAEFQHLNIQIIYGTWSKEQGRDGWRRLTAGVTVLLHSLVAHIPASLYPVGWPACPRSPRCFAPAAVGDRAWSEGWGKSHSHLVQSDQHGLRWGRGGSCVPLHQWQDRSANDDTLSTGDSLFSLLDRDGKKALLFWEYLYFSHNNAVPQLV